MKNKLLSILTIAIVLCSYKVSAQITLIPDANFEQELIDLEIDSDETLNGQVLTSDINTIEVLNLDNKNISDFTGLEGFTALRNFRARSNPMTSIDVSANIALERLVVGASQLASIDLSTNVNLFQFAASNANLTSFQITPSIQTLNLDNNNLTDLDVSPGTSLIRLRARNNPNLQSLNVATGNNASFATFLVSGNPNLFCIQVDDIAVAQSNFGAGVDPQAAFSLDCSGFATGFITTWKTDTSGPSSNTQIEIPTDGTGYNYTVNWGDGSIDTGVTANAIHTYAASGTYTVIITGDFPTIQFNGGGDRSKLLTIEQWGDIAWGSFRRSFRGCNNLQVTTTEAPDLSNVTLMDNMFRGCSNLNQDFSAWNTTGVTNINRIFEGANSFNGDITTWDVSGISNFGRMFVGASSFNQDISGWTVDNMTFANRMFQGATSFDQNLGSWNVSNLNSASNMFLGVTLSTDNYDALLTGWNSLGTLRSNVNFHGGNSQFCTSLPDRENLTDPAGRNWTIADGGSADTEGPTIVCQAITVQLDVNGMATIVATSLDGGTTDNCGLDTFVIDIDTFDCSQIGANDVVLTVTDIHGNSSMCTATVTVEDTLPVSIISGPVDIFTGTGTNDSSCSGVVNYDAVTPDSFVIDSNCGDNSTITVAQTAGLGSGAAFPVGTTVEEYTLTDMSGNETVYTFEITVTDTTIPSIDCPDEITVTVEEGSAHSIEDYTSLVSDNCSTGDDLVVVQEPAVGTEITENTQVTLSATDAAGNETTCEFTIVVDETLSVEAESFRESAISLYPVPTTGVLNIQATVEIDRAEVYDLGGRLVKTQRINGNATIDLSYAESGVYLVYLIQGDQTVIKRIIKE